MAKFCRLGALSDVILSSFSVVGLDFNPTNQPLFLSRYLKQVIQWTRFSIYIVKLPYRYSRNRVYSNSIKFQLTHGNRLNYFLCDFLSVLITYGQFTLIHIFGFEYYSRNYVHVQSKAKS
jgi:hypothetical protein